MSNLGFLCEDLCGLYVSVVNLSKEAVNHKAIKNTEDAQRI